MAFLNQLRFASSRELGFVAAIALAAAVGIDRIAPTVALNRACVGILIALGVGIGVFALGAFARERSHR